MPAIMLNCLHYARLDAAPSNYAVFYAGIKGGGLDVMILIALASLHHHVQSTIPFALLASLPRARQHDTPASLAACALGRAKRLVH